MNTLSLVLDELQRARAKFPTWPTDPLHALAVLGEEFGELTQATLQAVYEPHKSNMADVREEAIQTAAMALRFVESLDRYQLRPCHQHDQRDPLARPHGTSEGDRFIGMTIGEIEDQIARE